MIQREPMDVDRVRAMALLIRRQSRLMNAQRKAGHGPGDLALLREISDAEVALRRALAAVRSQGFIPAASEQPE